MIRRVSKPGQRVFSGYKNFNENIDGHVIIKELQLFPLQ
jgi:hypothetical protein